MRDWPVGEPCGASAGKVAEIITPRGPERLVAIGASTGGVEALVTLMGQMPADSPPIVITQHMPGNFTGGFARRLDRSSPLAISEARDGDRLRPGAAFLAPGDFHLEVIRDAAGLVCRLHDGAPISGHRPSVDVLFRSVALSAGSRAVGVILTGMGRDGAEGLLEMRKAGARTIGQDEATSVVYGMPRAARQLGAVQTELPLGSIAAEILRNCRK